MPYNNVYDTDGKPLEEYDLEKGRLVPSTRKIHHEAVEGVEEIGHWHTIAEYPETGGKDVEWIVDTPGVEARGAWDEIEDIYVYTPYTEEELAQIEAEKRKQEEEAHRLDDIEAALIELANIIAGGE